MKSCATEISTSEIDKLLQVAMRNMPTCKSLSISLVKRSPWRKIS